MLVYYDGFDVTVIATKLRGDALVRYDVKVEDEVKGTLIFDESMSGDRESMVQDVLQANGFMYDPDCENEYVFG